MSNEAESSGQALERFMKEQFTVLAIEVPEDDLEMMARFVEEEGLEKDEKVEGVRAMIEGFVDPLPENINPALESIVDEYDRLKALELAALEEEESSSSEDEDAGKRGNILDTLTPEELKQAQKQALLRQYAYVDADPDELAMAGLSLEGRDPNAPAKSAKEKEGEREKEERRKAIEEALRLDGKKKKHRKNKEAPNLNKEKMLYKAQMERDAQKSTAQMKKERDKAALDKQRADAAAAKAAKQKKAAKGERRA